MSGASSFCRNTASKLLYVCTEDRAVHLLLMAYQSTAEQKQWTFALTDLFSREYQIFVAQQQRASPFFTRSVSSPTKNHTSSYNANHDMRYFVCFTMKEIYRIMYSSHLLFGDPSALCNMYKLMEVVSLRLFKSLKCKITRQLQLQLPKCSDRCGSKGDIYLHSLW